MDPFFPKLMFKLLLIHQRILANNDDNPIIPEIFSKLFYSQILDDQPMLSVKDTLIGKSPLS